ncbi:protein FAR1-RELATED SEQUENCE 5-like [Lolium perenne]|uniref:protein FAR1-RELATED SEQUENCE 5-like n=1 Tax=Lolium perenne TaxID=4522 RepID=UPI003A99E82C
MKDRTYRHRPESRCNCGAHFSVSYNRKKGVWTVLRFDDNHNHKPATADQIAFMRSHRKIKAHQKSRIMSPELFGMRLFNIMRTFISDNGKYSMVGFVRKDLYNMSCREKRKMLAKGDANTTIGIMEKRKRDDPEFYFDYKLGKGGKLLHLFWCDSQSRQDYADFGDVLVFDSTYKTNRYAMPFIPFVGINNHRQTTVFACAIVSDEKEVTYKWLLETFLKAMYQQKPKGIITDGDAAMIAAVGKVFPGVWYRVCTWHIEKNMKKHIDSLAHNEFRSLLYYTTSEQVFEERWRAFVEKHQTELTKEWMKRMYRRKKLWSAAYLANGYFLGMKSNQRSESLNSTLHTHLDFGLTMVDMVVHYENNSSRVREEEARQDTIDSQTVPVAVTRYKDIEMSAARKFTATNFYLVQGELKKIGGLEIVDQLGCLWFSKDARYGLPSRRESDLYGWGWEGVAERRKHSELTQIGAEAFDAALHDPESYSELMKCMKGIIHRRKGDQNSRSTAYHEDAQNRGDAPVVGDPDKAETKGAPKQNKKYYKDKDTNQQTSKHGRILSHDERKKERLCTACNQPGHNRNNKMKCRLHKE